MNIVFKTLKSFLANEEYRSLLIATGITILVGTIVYRYLENWSWLDSLYFSFVSLTTIGYGDLSPITTYGKIFTIFYIIVGVGIILTFINTVYLHYFSKRK